MPATGGRSASSAPVWARSSASPSRCSSACARCGTAPPRELDSRRMQRAADKLLVAARLVTLVLWNVPYGWIALYPFKLFATWLHESSHAVVMILTGAGLDRLEIFRDTSGLAYPARGVTAAGQAFISCAGYMGTAFFGALFL